MWRKAKFKQSLTGLNTDGFSQSAGAVEYVDCISVEV